MDNETVLDIKDFLGRRVILGAGRWRDHIQARHPEVLGCLRRIELTLTDPAFVYEDDGPRTTRLYYRLGAIDRFRNLYLVVIVRFDFEPAQVTTAYVARAPSAALRRLVYVKPRH